MLSCSEYLKQLHLLGAQYDANNQARDRELADSSETCSACVQSHKDLAAQKQCEEEKTTRDIEINKRYDLLEEGVNRRIDALDRAAVRAKGKLMCAVYADSTLEKGVRLSQTGFANACERQEPYWFDTFEGLVTLLQKDRCCGWLLLYVLGGKAGKLRIGDREVTFATLAKAVTGDNTTKVSDYVAIYGRDAADRAPTSKEVEPLRTKLAAGLIKVYWPVCPRKRADWSKADEALTRAMDEAADCRKELEAVTLELNAVTAEEVEILEELLGAVAELVESDGESAGKAIETAGVVLAKIVKVYLLDKAGKTKLQLLSSKLNRVKADIEDADKLEKVTKQSLDRCLDKLKLKRSWTGSITWRSTESKDQQNKVAGRRKFSEMTWQLEGKVSDDDDDPTHWVAWRRTVSNRLWQSSGSDPPGTLIRGVEGYASGRSYVRVTYEINGGLTIDDTEVPLEIPDGEYSYRAASDASGKSMGEERSRPGRLDLLRIPPDVQHQTLAGSKIAGSTKRPDGTGVTEVEWDLTVSTLPE